MQRRALALTAAVAAGLLLAACAQETSGGGSSSAPAPAPSSSSAAPAPSSESASPTATPDECAKENLATLMPGMLTIGTDSPAYPPYFVDDDPSNGQGFESAVAYAVAEGLGFTPEEVMWTVVPFNKSYAPGAKDFDFDINQISITPKRAEVVTFSDGYYTVNQAVVALADSPIANATTLAELQGAKLGAQVGTTSLQYITAVEIPKGKIVGQFPAQDGGEQFGMLFQKDNPLVTCVNKVLGELTASGELQAIQDEWLAGTAAPYFKE